MRLVLPEVRQKRAAERHVGDAILGGDDAQRGVVKAPVARVGLNLGKAARVLRPHPIERLVALDVFEPEKRIGVGHGADGRSWCGWKTNPAGRPASHAASAGGSSGFHRLASKRQPLISSASRDTTKTSGGTISSGSTRRDARPSALALRISSAMPGVLAPAPGLTMLTVIPVSAASLAHTSVAISSAAFDAP